MSHKGFTAPGTFLFELLGRVGVTPATMFPLIRTLESAAELLADQALDAGNRQDFRFSWILNLTH